MTCRACGTWWTYQDLVGHTRTWQDIPGLVGLGGYVSGLGGTYQELRDLVGHTGTILGLGWTYQELRDLLLRTGTWLDIRGLGGTEGQSDGMVIAVTCC